MSVRSLAAYTPISSVAGTLNSNADVPSRVFQVVIVEVDGAVLLSGVAVVHLLAGPVVAGDGPSWKIDRDADRASRRGVHDAAGRRVAREVPRGERIGGPRPC